MTSQPLHQMEGSETPLQRGDRYQLDPVPLNKQNPAKRIHNWDEVFQGFTREEAMYEASRCLECGVYSECRAACPLQNQIPEAMALIAQGRFAEAGKMFLETSNMPDVCGRICPQEILCEGSCVMCGTNTPVRIGKLEAFCVDTLRETEGVPVPEAEPATGYKVGIIGAGPAGLAVAEELAKLGHGITVFEHWPRPGGLLTYGIPSFKLKKEVPAALIDRLEKLGVEFHCGVSIGREHGIEQLLREEGFDGIFLGHGATAGKPMRIPGEELKHVYPATEFLVRSHVPLEELPPEFQARPYVGKVTAVIGGGDTAMDCVRSARRMNPAGEVYCVYRRTEAEMPGRREERIHAHEEGVKFEWLTLPKRFLGNQRGEVCAMECIRMKLGEPDSSGRRRPVEIPGSEFTLDVDTVALGLGYDVDPEISNTTENLKVTRWGSIWVESEATGHTSREEIWAAGDNVRGADLVVTAVAAARHAAQDIHRTLLKKLPKAVFAAG